MILQKRSSQHSRIAGSMQRKCNRVSCGAPGTNQPQANALDVKYRAGRPQDLPAMREAIWEER